MGPEIVFIFLIICASAMVFGIRYMSNKEKMAMIERGIDPGISKARQAAPKPFLSLKFGLLLVGLGIGLLFALFTTVNIEMSEEQNVAVYFGCLGIFGGFGLIISYIIEKKWLDQQPQD
ncbi:NADH:ubiquinone oxidoreductase subunit 5 (subunit L)/multisubunit Na+/H+ antiporter MnhA subunit [Pedobacter sp. CG_S7]|uniref:DUF6249 domain-containing protein n=1 Tax=Pedobacter sp. CG_S7 TaxID=3143930 RepID=UPI003398126B